MKYIFANWKMYLNFDETMILTNQLLNESFSENVSMGLFPNTLAVSEVEKAVCDTPFLLGAQTVNWIPKGAYTGETSALFFKDMNCDYALVGHSERRYIFGETNDDIRKKLESCLDVGLTPVLCIGETKEDHSDDKVKYRLQKQLVKAMKGLDIGNNDFFIAYEPVWAVGTGVPCMPGDVDDIQGWIIQEIKQYTDKKIPILYGGSVNVDNVVSYVSLDTVDGVLVGGATTKMETFLPLIRAVESI